MINFYVNLTKMNKTVQKVRMVESGELPIRTGIIEVDTTKGPVTIFMKKYPPHNSSETLIITKISKDNEMVSLYSDKCLIEGSDIVMFGLPSYAKVPKGKIRTIVLQNNGNQWKILDEQ